MSDHVWLRKFLTKKLLPNEHHAFGRFCYWSPITDQLLFHAIIDHRSIRSLINRPSLVVILLDGWSIFDHPIINHRSPITDHRSSYAFNVPGCRTITDHRSSIIDHRSSIIVRFYASDAVVSVVRSPIIDHRSSINRLFLRMLCTMLSYNQITDCWSKTAQPVPNSWTDHRPSITDKT